MRIIIISLCSLLFLGYDALAESNNDITKGQYPYTALVYYSDESIKDVSGNRFLRGAILIKPNRLISSAIDPIMMNGVPIGFPQKTLLARVGAIAIDSNFTINEDEDEQEREVIQIIRPYNHSITEWWYTDITVLKTLLAFNISSSVSTVSIEIKKEQWTNCFILVYAQKLANVTEDKILMKLSVEILPRSKENCGNLYREQTALICAADSDENKGTSYDPQFCQGNSGGPLICEGEVTALQTYIEGNCKQPHLYQTLQVWNKFITCANAEDLHNNGCNNTFVLTNKDTPVEIIENSVSHVIEAVENSISALSPTITSHEASSVTHEVSSTTSEISSTIIEVSSTTTTNMVSETDETIIQNPIVINDTETETSKSVSTKNETNESHIEKKHKENEPTTSWSKEQRRKLDQSREESDGEHKANVEAQQQDESMKLRSTAEQSMAKKIYIMCSISFSIMIRMCMD